MKKISSSFLKPGTYKIIFLLSILTAIFWIAGMTTDIYHFALVGAIFEILWFPAIALVFILPVLSLLCWINDKLNTRSINLYSFLIIMAAVLVILYKK